MKWLISGLVLLPVALYLLRYGRDLWGIWKEPVLRHPVLIFESDDWGPAEDREAGYLLQIAGILEKYRDRDGNHPVMTLGMVLSVPDSNRIRASGGDAYFELSLDAPRFAAIREAISEGVRRGVFAVQLHGMAHFLPETVVKAAKSDPGVRAWLTQDGLPDARELPDALQSRWTDGAELPSLKLDSSSVADLAAREVAAFSKVFGRPPRVAVPPTFVWTDAVEQGWASAGVRFIVTPGERIEMRDAQGRPVGSGNALRSGEGGRAAGISYLVRDRYFEPSLGHTASQAAEAMQEQWDLRRPTLLEMHRFNFNGSDAADRDNALDQLDRALRMILEAYPGVHFMSTQALGESILEERPGSVEQSIFRRVYWFQKRVRSEMPLIRRLLPV